MPHCSVLAAPGGVTRLMIGIVSMITAPAVIGLVALGAKDFGALRVKQALSNQLVN